ncbi:DeoR/GlpR family DNA-binding transcription regulator [Georgenia deserti]|uniref:DeoR/GlpR family DNA-binding transcription regulator n=1 Tax=Georgenia deserti TaxID=2093781 RepID=A0ABW4L5G3_9MICO
MTDVTLESPDGEVTRARFARAKATRLKRIADAVRLEGFISVDTLSQDLGVSRMTVHRDLDELEKARVLRKVRGGASAERSTTFESDFQYRANAALREKKAVAHAAAALASDGDVVVIGDSSTTSHVVPDLAALTNVTVVTNFLPVMESVAREARLELISLGGQFNPEHRAFVGLLCEQALSTLYADVLFASSSALLGSDVYHQFEPIVKVKQAMIRSSRTRVLLLDHTKLGRGALHRVGPVSDFTHVVVDDQADPEQLAPVRDAGVEVIVAPV